VGIEDIDMQVMMWVQRHRSAPLDAFFTYVTWAGSLYVLLPLVLLLTGYSFVCGKREAIGLIGLGFGGSVLLAHLLKMFLRRPRPSLFEPVVSMPADFSFPSAHTAQITGFCLCLILIFGKDLGPIGFWMMSFVSIMLIGCVACSRVYLQVHFTSDVVAGILLPVMWIFGMALMLNRS
jgi:undecaprenyl-diphosphatase